MHRPPPVHRNLRRCAVPIAAAVLGLAAGSAAVAADAAEHAAEVEAWHAGRIERLTDEEGWLSLVGLFWLQDGANRLGSAGDNEIPFPEGKAPARIGVVHRDPEGLRLEVEPSVEVLHEGEPVTRLELEDDAAGAPTLLEHGDLVFYVIRRGDRQAVRIKDRRSPVRAAFEGIERYPVDPAWRIEAELDRYEPLKTLSVPTVLGEPAEEPCVGAVVFEAGGEVHRLDVIADADDERLFIVFADATTGDTTYGGGRYLYADAPGPDGRVVVDFNKSYNPPCVFTPYATCPLPPRQNRLEVRIEAGEKMYGPAH